MKKKIIITIIFVVIIAVGLIFYFYNKQTTPVKHNNIFQNREYVKVQFKNSPYEFPFYVKKGSSIDDAVKKVFEIETFDYKDIEENGKSLNKIMGIAENSQKFNLIYELPIIKDTVFTVIPRN